MQVGVKENAEQILLMRERLLAILTEATRELFLNPDWFKAVLSSFREIGLHLQVDRMYLFRLDGPFGKAETISQIVEWNSGTSEPQINNPDLQKLRLADFEPFYLTLSKGEPLREVVSEISDERFKVLLESQEIKSVLLFPVQVRGIFWGFLGFDQCTHERVWSDAELSVLRSFSTALAGSIEKREAEAEKTEWKTKHELVVRASGQIIYDYDIPSGQIQWSGNTQQVLGYQLSEMGGIERWVELIHAEDRDASIRKLEEAEKAMLGYDVFYRFRHKDGSYKNMHDRGLFLSDAFGKAYRMLGMMMDVTESTNRDTEKREIELAYKTLFDNTPDAIIITNTELPSRIVSANQAAAEMHGYDLEAFGKLCIHDVKSPEYIERLPARLENLLKGDRTPSESTHRRKDGTLFPVMIVSGVIDVRGQKYIMSIFRDVSESVRTQNKLEESLSLLTATIESTADGILVVDTDGKVAAFNKKFLKLWKIPAEMSLEKDDSSLLAHVVDQVEDPEAFLSKVKYLYASPLEKSEDLIRFKDGRVFHRYSKPQKIGEKVVGRVWSFRDFTDQFHYEQSLQESEARFKRLQEASFGGICIHDNGTIIDANQGLSDISGYSREELIGMNGIGTLIAPEYTEEVIAHIESGSDQPYDVEGIRKDGSRCFLEVQGKNIPYKGGTIRVSEFRDITSRKEAEQQLLQEKTSLMATTRDLIRKNEQLEEFTQIVSHNLRSPAGNISTLLQLHNEASNDEEKAEILNLLQQTSKSLLTTMQELNEVLNIKHNENIIRQQLSFSHVFERVKKLFHAKILESSAAVTHDFSQAPFLVYSNVYLESVILNLLSNALKYHDPRKKSFIDFKTSLEGGCIILRVSDNGLGINLERYGHQIFKMKKTFHRHPDSRGIGLFMIRNQIESMGGEISVSSQEGVGTTFTVNFNKTR